MSKRFRFLLKVIGRHEGYLNRATAQKNLNYGKNISAENLGVFFKERRIGYIRTLDGPFYNQN